MVSLIGLSLLGGVGLLRWIVPLACRFGSGLLLSEGDNIPLWLSLRLYLTKASRENRSEWKLNGIFRFLCVSSGKETQLPFTKQEKKRTVIDHPDLPMSRIYCGLNIA